MKPLELTQEEVQRERILYLAKYASHSGPAHAVDPQHGISPWYHQEIRECLGRLGVYCLPAENLEDLFRLTGQYTYVFTLFNRAPFRNSEVFASAVCEYLHMPYLGAMPHTRAVAEDKQLAKILARHLGIPTPSWMAYRARTSTVHGPEFQGPYLVKPRCGAGSQHIDADSVCDTWGEVRTRVQVLSDAGLDSLVEQFVPGRNITVPVLGHEDAWVLPCLENVSTAPGNILTRRQKQNLDPGLSRRLYDNAAVCSSLATAARSLYDAVQPIDYLRADFRVDDATGTFSFLEFNVCCNLGTHSTMALGAQSVGLSHEQLLGHILAFSIRRQRAQK